MNSLIQPRYFKRFKKMPIMEKLCTGFKICAKINLSPLLFLKRQRDRDRQAELPTTGLLLKCPGTGARAAPEPRAPNTIQVFHVTRTQVPELSPLSPRICTGGKLRSAGAGTQAYDRGHRCQKHRLNTCSPNSSCYSIFHQLLETPL